MDTFRKAFAFCGLTVLFEADEPIADIREYAVFYDNNVKTPDIRVRVLRKPLPMAAGDIAMGKNRRRRIVSDRAIYDYTFLPDAARLEFVPYACAVRRGDAVELLIDYEQPLRDTMLFDALNLPDLLLEHGVGLLHASFIGVNGRAILFAGPKQIGKSTQAELWRLHRNALIVNGDRAGVRFENGGAAAFGLPFCGMSGICLNRRMPVAAIVFPQKEELNRATRLSAIDAFRQLIGCLSYTDSDPDTQLAAIGLAERIVTSCPCFRLACRPDAQAVDVLAEALGI